jgi:hypothetical protein
MNSTRGSTPQNPTLDLQNRSTDLNKTLGILGTPHEESIAKFNPIKTRPKKEESRKSCQEHFQPKNSRNPKIEHLYSRIWEGNHNPKNHEGFPQISPIKSPRERSEKQPKEITKRGPRKSPPRTTGENTSNP